VLTPTPLNSAASPTRGIGEAGPVRGFLFTVLAPLPPERYTVSSNCACFISSTMNTCAAALCALNKNPLPPAGKARWRMRRIQLCATDQNRSLKRVLSINFPCYIRLVPNNIKLPFFKPFWAKRCVEINGWKILLLLCQKLIYS
jgi:hypothetical protein